MKFKFNKKRTIFLCKKAVLVCLFSICGLLAINCVNLWISFFRDGCPNNRMIMKEKVELLQHKIDSLETLHNKSINGIKEGVGE